MSRSRKRKRSAVAEQERAAKIARDLADPRWQRIRVRNPNVGKWWAGVVIGGARGNVATRGLDGSSVLVLYEDGEERVEDLDEVEWEERESVAVQARPAVSAKISGLTSKYRGVSWNKRDKKWLVTIRMDGKSKTIAYFVDETAAARTYDAFVIAKKLGKPLNFPDDPAAKGHVVTSSKTSRFRGVSWVKSRKKWQVKIRVGGKQKSVGRFDDEIEAAQSYDAYAIEKRIDTPRNFPGLAL